MRKQTTDCPMNSAENPHRSILNPEVSGRASLYYLWRLPNASVEIGSKNGFVCR